VDGEDFCLYCFVIYSARICGGEEEVRARENLTDRTLRRPRREYNIKVYSKINRLRVKRSDLAQWRALVKAEMNFRAP
jgi:hypothetical protein